MITVDNVIYLPDIQISGGAIAQSLLNFLDGADETRPSNGFNSNSETMTPQTSNKSKT
jgi:hypothetical protein